MPAAGGDVAVQVLAAGQRRLRAGEERGRHGVRELRLVPGVADARRPAAAGDGRGWCPAPGIAPRRRRAWRRRGTPRRCPARWPDGRRRRRRCRGATRPVRCRRSPPAGPGAAVGPAADVPAAAGDEGRRRRRPAPGRAAATRPPARWPAAGRRRRRAMPRPTAWARPSAASAVAAAVTRRRVAGRRGDGGRRRRGGRRRWRAPTAGAGRPRETSNRYRLYSFISAMRFAPYSGSVA